MFRPLLLVALIIVSAARAAPGDPPSPRLLAFRHSSAVCETALYGSWGIALINWNEVISVTPKGLDSVEVLTRNSRPARKHGALAGPRVSPEEFLVVKGVPPFKPQLLEFRTLKLKEDAPGGPRARIAKAAKGMRDLQAACARWRPDPIDLMDLPHNEYYI